YQGTGIQPAERAQMVPALTVGDMSHGAGIENVDIGVLIGGYYAKPGIEEFACQRFAFRLVELATNGLKSNSRSVNVIGVFALSGVHAMRNYYIKCSRELQIADRLFPLTSAPVPSSP
ncbi:hypothetical protein M1N85_04555, partial [Dehalococcoidia bacterium]|nr:hypothetical protein [Dehalococcoidia bacterium]